MENSIITIDGPSAVGKSSLGFQIAKALNYKLLDSGSIYRAASLYIFYGLFKNESLRIIIDKLKNININFYLGDKINKIYLDGIDITKIIRSEKIGILSSKIANFKQIRNSLLEKQRIFSRQSKGLVADGRDMGTIVFPKARIKFFLSGNLLERASRRYNQLKINDNSVNYKKIISDMSMRDFEDKDRLNEHIGFSKNTFYIDTTKFSMSEVFNMMMIRINSILK